MNEKKRNTFDLISSFHNLISRKVVSVILATKMFLGVTTRTYYVLMRIYERRTVEGLCKEKKLKNFPSWDSDAIFLAKFLRRDLWQNKSYENWHFYCIRNDAQQKKIRRFKNELTRSFNLNPFSNKYINNCGMLDLWGPFRRFLHWGELAFCWINLTRPIKSKPL